MRVRSFCAVLFVAVLALMLAAAPAQAKKVKAAFALLWTIDDQGWTTSHYRGIEHLKKELGEQVEVSYTEKVVSPADAERVIRDYAQKGYDIIFGTTFTHMDAMVSVAKDFPNIKFEHCSGFKTAPNLGTYFVRMYQAEYLAGYLAGLMGYKNVGTVATHPIPEIIRGINAFTLGQTRGLTEAGVKFDAENINTVAWLNKWRDPVNETTLAETLVAKKHDLIRQMADTPDSAKAACAKGVAAIGYGEDVAPYGAQCALASTVFNWGPVYTGKVKAVLDGAWKMDQYWGGFEDDGVIFASINKEVPEDVKAKVLAVKEQLVKGEDTIFTGPITAQDGKPIIAQGAKATDPELLSMRVFVKGVNGKIPQ